MFSYLDFDAGKVCALGALCPISYPIELEGDGGRVFCNKSNDWSSPPATGPVSGYVVVLSFQRAAHLRTHWAPPAYCAIICSLSRVTSMGEALESVVNRFCLTTNGLRSPRNHTISSEET